MRFIGFIFYFYCSAVFASSPVAFNTNNVTDKQLAFNEYCSVYHCQKRYTPQHIWSLIELDSLAEGIQAASQGFSYDFYWLHFKLDWTASTDMLILELDNPHIDRVVIYQKQQHGFERIGIGGDRGLSFKDRTYNNRRYLFPLQALDTITDYLLMVDKRYASVSFPLKIWNKQQFEQYESKQNIFYGLYFGMLFFVGFVSLFSAFILKNKSFLLYSIYVVLMALYIFTALGFSFQFLYPASTTFNNYSRVLLIVAIAFATVLFMRDYLLIDQYLPHLTKVFKGFNFLFTVMFVVWLLNIKSSNEYVIWILNTIYILFFLLFLFIYYAAAMQLRRIKAKVLLFFLAYTSMVAGSGLFIGIEYGWMQEEWFPINPVLVGSAMEILILSLGMLFFARDLQTQKINLESKSHNLTHQNQYLLNQYSELEKNNEELQKKNFILKERQQVGHAPTQDTWITLSDNHQINHADIMHIRSDGHYLEFFLIGKDKPNIDRNTIKKLMIELPAHNFARVHRSHIVNIHKIQQLKSTEIILTDGKVIPLSRTYKPSIKALIK